MKRFGALLAFTLLLALVLPGSAGALDDLAGKWTATIDDADVLLLLGDDGNAITISRSEDDADVQVGTWSQEPGFLLLHDGKDVLRLAYTLENGVLSAWEEGQEDDKGVFNHTLWLPPDALVGAWEGADSSGGFVLALRDDNTYALDYATGAAISAGTFAVNAGTLYLVQSDAMCIIFLYETTPSGMTITNISNDTAYPVVRRQSAQTTATPPAVTDAPQPPAVTDAPQPPAVTDVPQPSPAIAQGLIGVWQGTDASGAHTFAFGEDGSAVLTYQDEANTALNRSGFFISSETNVIVSFPGGETRQMRYLLLGDSLLLSDMNLQNPVTYVRFVPQVLPLGLDPAFLGTWGGYGADGYFEFTFGEGGAYKKTVLPDETRSHSGAAASGDGRLTLTHAGGEESYDVTLAGDTLDFGGGVTAKKLPGPLSRELLPEAAAAPAVDQALAGVWGAMVEDDLYAELAFLPDGRFLGFSPLSDPESVAGSYLAQNGALAMLTQRDAAQGTYSLENGALTLTLSGREPVTLMKKDGLLRRDAAVAP